MRIHGISATVHHITYIARNLQLINFFSFRGKLIKIVFIFIQLINVRI